MFIIVSEIADPSGRAVRRRSSNCVKQNVFFRNVRVNPQNYKLSKHQNTKYCTMNKSNSESPKITKCISCIVIIKVYILISLFIIKNPVVCRQINQLIIV